ncbi:MAG TPA: hypothetical protein EYP36_05710 [Calditrichaeota bacterium]|nr:hypothetical protein [Calditrichota bacterium]
MKWYKSIFLFVLASLIVAGCKLDKPVSNPNTVTPNEKLLFSRFVALGDNIVAGYQNAAMTDSLQRYSFVNLMAEQAEVENFVQPLLGYPGLGSESLAGYGTLKLKYLDDPKTPNTIIPDPVIIAIPFSDYPDFDPLDPYVSEEIKTHPLPYNNLGIPGIVLEDVLIAIDKLHSRSHSPLIDVVLRNPAAGNLTPFQQARAFVPSLIVCWAGMYDVLGYALYNTGGTKLTQPTPAAEFAEHFASLMDSLQSIRGAGLLVGNIPDILDMPYFNTVSPFVIDTVTNTPYLDDSGNKVPLIGVNPETDIVLFPARQATRQGYGIPSGILNGNGEALPEDFVLTTDEQNLIHEAIDGYNTAIDTITQNKEIIVVDMYSFFKRIKNGYSYAGFTFTAEAITGGFYSLDGVHPSILGNALIANEWLNKINRTLRSGSFYVSIPLIDVIQLMNDLQPQNR